MIFSNANDVVVDAAAVAEEVGNNRSAMAEPAVGLAFAVSVVVAAVERMAMAMNGRNLMSEAMTMTRTIGKDICA